MMGPIAGHSLSDETTECENGTFRAMALPDALLVLCHSAEKIKGPRPNP